MNEPVTSPRSPVTTAPDSVGGAALKLAIIGPSHPHETGVAAHTTTLAHHLAQAGHDVTLVSWLHPWKSVV